jgi:hypothetical protein
MTHIFPGFPQQQEHPDDKRIIRHCKVDLSPYKVPYEVKFVAAIEYIKGSSCHTGSNPL